MRVGGVAPRVRVIYNLAPPSNFSPQIDSVFPLVSLANCATLANMAHDHTENIIPIIEPDGKGGWIGRWMADGDERFTESYSSWQEAGRALREDRKEWSLAHSRLGRTDY